MQLIRPWTEDIGGTLYTTRAAGARLHRRQCIKSTQVKSLLTAKPMLGRSLFLLKNRFLSSYCQISTDLDKILHTPIVVRNTLVGRLRPRSAHGRFQAKPERLCFFVIFVTHPKSYIETSDRRDFGGKPSEWRR